MQETFYATLAGASFALLGLWWVVVEARHDRWSVDARRRRTAQRVSWYFTLPGVMSLLSLLSAGAPLLWRTAFVLAAAVGAMEAASMGAAAPAAARLLPWLGVAGWGAVVVVAAVPGVTDWLGLTSLQTAGVLLSLLLLVGVQWAWSIFLAPADAASAAIVE